MVNLARERTVFNFLCALANAIVYTCGRIAGGRSLAVYAMQLVGATTVQAAVEKEAKGLPLHG